MASKLQNKIIFLINSSLDKNSTDPYIEGPINTEGPTKTESKINL